VSGSFEFRDYFSGKREEQAGLDRAVPRLGLPKGCHWFGFLKRTDAEVTYQQSLQDEHKN
jgi:hypothetical protein